MAVLIPVFVVDPILAAFFVVFAIPAIACLLSRFAR